LSLKIYLVFCPLVGGIAFRVDALIPTAHRIAIVQGFKAYLVADDKGLGFQIG